ncbi:MAG: CBS domain-containing protein [Deltaproteobacteria bacterium]|nr:CBS domain-containing protein [Deltaproteobacteria bacterium]
MENERDAYDPLVEHDEAYFDPERPRSFDATLLEAPAGVLQARRAHVLSREDSVTDAVRAMQKEHRGVVVITEDGTDATPVIGIFTERDVLFRIIDGGRNPATLPLEQVMTSEPDCLGEDGTVADVLRMMSVGGFRHVPLVDEQRRPVGVVSVRDVVDLLVEAFPTEIVGRGAERQSERDGG